MFSQILFFKVPSLAPTFLSLSAWTLRVSSLWNVSFQWPSTSFLLPTHPESNSSVRFWWNDASFRMLICSFNKYLWQGLYDRLCFRPWKHRGDRQIRSPSSKSLQIPIRKSSCPLMSHENSLFFGFFSLAAFRDYVKWRS